MEYWVQYVTMLEILELLADNYIGFESHSTIAVYWTMEEELGPSIHLDYVSFTGREPNLTQCQNCSTCVTAIASIDAMVICRHLGLESDRAIPLLGHGGGTARSHSLQLYHMLIV